MRRLLKKLTALAMAAVMMVGMGAAAMAVDTTNARFVKESGDELTLDMGTKVIDSATYADGKIKVTLKTAEIGTTIFGTFVGFTGTIDSVAVNGVNRLATDDDGNSYFEVLPSEATTISGQNFKGVLVTLHFNMSPTTPPGMSDTMNAYFTCNSFD